MDVFAKHHENWLQSYFDLPSELLPSSHAVAQPSFPVPGPSHAVQGPSHAVQGPSHAVPGPSKRTVSASSTSGRPAMEFSSVSESTKRHHVADLAARLQSEPVEKLMKSVELTVKRHGQLDLSYILKEAAKSPNRPSKIRQRLSESKPTSCSDEEALALILDGNLSVNTYQMLRRTSITHGFPLFPPYANVLKAKAFCRPCDVEITETSASVPLNKLLDHTASRILLLQEEPLTMYAAALKTSSLTLSLSASWGFDGSTGQSQYKQNCEGCEGASDAGLFVTTVIPLQLVSNEGHPLWHNPAPQSVRFCRPLRIQFLKESPETILSERHWVDNQIKALEELHFNFKNLQITVKYKLYLTVIDGKVLSIISGATSQQCCPICKATPTQFNDIERQLFVPQDESLLEYGLSPLHLWIRCFEFCLHLGYRNAEGLRTWRVSGGKNNPQFVDRKQYIQTQLSEKLALKVDIPKPGGAGTSNDGNTARRAFSPQHQSTFAEILGIERWLVEGLHTILCAVSSELPINPTKFGEFCKVLANKYVSTYKWFYLPVTIHKILAHGEAIIRKSALPVGMLSEQAGESRNKLYRRDREFHSRKTSRKENLLDVFNRAMDSSDPIVSDYSMVKRQEKCKKLPLPPSAIALLQEPDEEAYVPRQLFQEESEEIPAEEDFSIFLDDLQLDTEESLDSAL